MSSESRSRLVGAVFPKREAAAAAAADLYRAGFRDEELASAEWLEGRYAIASHAGRKIGHSLWIGAVVGTVLGGLLGAAATALFWDAASMVTALVVGGIGGAVTGSILGAYFGLIRHRPQLWDEEDWAHTEVAEGEVLMVVDPGERPEVVQEILDRRGGRHCEPVHHD